MSYDTTSNILWPYDSPQDNDSFQEETEECGYCGAEFPEEMLTEFEGHGACDKCLSDLIHVK